MGATSSFETEFTNWVCDAGMEMTIQKMMSLQSHCLAAFVQQTQALMTNLASELIEDVCA